MARQINVVHYLNQFFGGLGGEEKANLPLQVVEGPVGPGKRLQQDLGNDGRVTATINCGDNFFNDEKATATRSLVVELTRLKPDVVVAGPAFNAGRYGLACGEVCKTAQGMGIPAAASMSSENPAVESYRRQVYILPTSENTVEMVQSLILLSKFALRLAAGRVVGGAKEEGYIPRGARRSALAPQPGYRRAVDMLAAKVNGRPFTTEIPVIMPDRVRPAPPVTDLGSARVALLTTGGLIPRGNPDRQLSGNPERYFRYSVAELGELTGDRWEAFHGGYFNATASADPNYILPLRAMRTFESSGKVGTIHPWIFTLPGVGTPVPKARRLGSEIAQELVNEGVQACVLVST